MRTRDGSARGRGRAVLLAVVVALGGLVGAVSLGGAAAAADTTAPSISNFQVSNPTGTTVKIAFVSNEQLGGLTAGISGAETKSLSLSEFKESSLKTGGYSYVATYTASTDGDYTGSLSGVTDTAGNSRSLSESGTVTISTSGDTTAPSISSVSLGESSGEMTLSFSSDEQLGGSASDVAVGVAGPNGGTYSFDRSQFSETSTNSGYQYTLTATQAYDDGDGSYTATVATAKDAAGNDGGDSSLTDSYSYSSGSSDTTAPTISGVSLGESSGDMTLSFSSDEQLGTSAGDVAVGVTGPNGGAYSFDRSQFSESGSGPYTYTLTATQAYDDGDGSYSSTVLDAKDAAGNNGGTNGAGSGLSDSYSYSSGSGDTTAPTVSSVTLSESSGNMVIAFAADEQLGGSASDVAVDVAGPNGGSYSFDRSQFTEKSTNSGYQYSLTATQAYDDGDGSYTATVATAKDAAGNDGGDSSLTDSHSYSSGSGDTTAPTISGVTLDGSKGNMVVAFAADEQLGGSASDVAVDVTGPNGGTYSFDRSQFTEKSTNSGYQYTLSSQQTYDDGDGSYSMVVATAKDAAGNDGGSSSLTDTYSYSSGSGPTGGGGGGASIVSKDIEYVSGPAKFQNDAEVEKNIDFDATASGQSLDLNLWVDSSKLSQGEQKRELTHSAVGFTEQTKVRLKVTVKNLDPDVLMGPADVDSWKVTDADTTDSERTVVIELHPTTAQRNFDASSVPSQWDSTSYQTSWDQAQVGVDATVSLQAHQFPSNTQLASLLDGARLNTDAQAFTVPQKSSSGALVFDVAAPHCKVGAKNDPNDPAAADECNSDYVYDDGFYEAVIPSGYVSTVWGDVDAAALTVVQKDDGKSSTLQSVSITERSSGAIYIQATDIHYSNPELQVKVDETAPTADAGPDASTALANAVTLDGSGSTDNGQITSYEWDVDGDGTTDATGETPSYTFSSPGSYDVTLTVIDGNDNTATDTVTIDVSDATAPTADAGSDATVSLGNAVSLDASASTDNHQLASYEWDVDGDGSGEATGATAAHTFGSPGSYDVTLTVTDAAGNTDTDTVTVDVNDVTPPTADAGDGADVAFGSAFEFDGTASSDNHQLATYEWDVDGDGSAEATGATPSYSFGTVGTYDVTLTVTDPAGNADTDTVTVDVLGGDSNADPVARVDSVGPVRSGDRVVLDGSDSVDSDGSVDSYDWEAHPFNDEVTLRDASDARASFVAPNVSGPTTLYFELAVTDGEGATDDRDVTVIVKPAANATAANSTAANATDAATNGTANTTATNATGATGNADGSTTGWTDVDGDGKLNVSPEDFQVEYPNLRYEVWNFLFD